MKRSTFLKTLVAAPAAIAAVSQAEPRITAQEVADRFGINACTLGDLERIVEGRYYSGRGLNTTKQRAAFY